MSFHQDFQHRAILSSAKVTPPSPKSTNLVHRAPVVTKRIPAFTSTDNTGANDLSLFTSQGVRGVFPPTATVWNPVRLDGGGFVTWMEIAADGTKFARTDTAGAFVWSPGATQWTQVVNHGSMPGTLAVVNTSPDNSFGNFFGVSAIAIAPSNTQHLYMYYTLGAGNQTFAYVYGSTNRGATWTRLNGTGWVNSNKSNANDQGSPSSRVKASQMRVDPANENIVYLSTPAAGVWTTSNGGTSWSQISTAQIPVSTVGGGNQGQGHLIQFDPTSVSGGKAQTIYASSYGHGLYKSTDGGSTWTIQNSTGMPTLFHQMYCDQAGIVWVVDDTDTGGYHGNLWKYTASTWTKVITASPSGTPPTQICTVTVDPSNAAHVYALDYHGYIWFSTNTGGSFTGCTTFTLSGTKNKWMEVDTQTIGANSLSFDPTQANVLYVGGGTGVWKTNPPTTNVNVVWNEDETVGIQNIDGTVGVSIPNGPVILEAQDRPSWIISNPASTQNFYVPFVPFNNDEGWGWPTWNRTSPSTWFAMSDGNGIYYTTTGGGQAAWTSISSVPAISQGLGRGNLQVYSNTNAVWAMSNDFGIACLTAGSLTGTPSWGLPTFTNGATPAAGGGWMHNHMQNQNILTLDEVLPSTYYLYNNGSGSNPSGVYKSTDGQTFSLQGSGGVIGAADTGNNFSMFAVPGNSGHLYAAPMANWIGPETNSGVLPDSNFQLWKSTNGGASWTAVPNVQSLFGFSLGAPKPGGSGYPALYAAGWASTNGGVTYTYGIWRADNADQATPTWVSIGDGFPNSNYDFIKFITADRNTYGTVYVGFSGSGFAYGKLQ